jgi:hypothetical protein
MRIVALASALILAGTGCASTPAFVPGADRNIITFDEIERARTPGWFAWDLISTLRPHFLRSQSAQTLTEREPIFARVYVDEIFHGEIESLKTLRLDSVMSVQFLPAFDAKTRFGEDMPGGAILIRTR